MEQHSKKRARIARATRKLEKALAGSELTKGRQIPRGWLPAARIFNKVVHTKKTLAPLLERAWTEGLVNCTGCYGKSRSFKGGCDPDVCKSRCTPTSLKPSLYGVYFFAGVGPRSEVRRIFQDGGTKCWKFVSSVKKSKKIDPTYEYRRYLGSGDFSEMRRSVVQFTDDDRNHLVWAVIYLPRTPPLLGFRLATDVSSSAWKDAVNDERFVQQVQEPFDPKALEIGAVYLTPSDFSFDSCPEFARFSRYVVENAKTADICYVKTSEMMEPAVTAIQVRKEKSRDIVRVGLVCTHCYPPVSRTISEFNDHIYTCEGLRK